jgi:hypothetical protein
MESDFFDKFKSTSDKTDKVRVVHFKKEPYDIYIGRLPGGKFNKWAYPRELRSKFPKGASRSEVIDAYEGYLISNLELMNDLHELRGKVLGCWCKNKDGKGKSCHGDILKKYVDRL